MKRSDWQNAFGETPDYFRRQLTSTLNGLEAGKMKKRYKISTVLIAAVLAVMMIVGAGVAAGNLGVFDMLNTADPIVPLEGAENMVETNLGSVENEFVKLSVEEAVYDGQGAIVQLRLSPKDTEKYALLNDMLQDTPEDIYDIERVPAKVPEGRQTLQGDSGEMEIVNEKGNISMSLNGENIEIPSTLEEAAERKIPVYVEDGTLYYADQFDFKIKGRKDGKEIVHYWVGAETIGVDAENAEAMGEEIFLNTWNAEEQPDGSVIIWAKGTANQAMEDEIQLKFKCGIYRGADAQETTVDELTVNLKRHTGNRNVTLVPTGDGTGERFQVLTGSISFSKVQGYLTVDYVYEQAEEEEMGITFKIYDAEGNQIAMGSGQTIELTAEDGSAYYHQIDEIQSFEEIPEKFWLEAKVIGEDKTLGRVECEAVPAE